MLDKRECVKAINASLEKITENMSDILGLLRTDGGGTRLEEMTGLVFAKKKTSELTEHLQRIFQNLVQLKLLHRNLHLKHGKGDALSEWWEV